jgi:flavin reductase (DIM6/NTAB) family NADH-FMN oxidoreductase RutF
MSPSKKQRAPSAKVTVPAKDRWRLLNPCPTVLVSAIGRATGAPADRLHLCAAAWCMPLDFAPHKAILILAARQATTEAVLDSGELVLNVPGAELSRAVLKAGSWTGHKVDKIARLGLTPLPSRVVNAPGVAECLAHLECRVLEHKTAFGRKLRDRFDLIPLEVVDARVNRGLFRKRWLLETGVRLLHHLGSEGFSVTGDLIFVEG